MKRNNAVRLDGLLAQETVEILSTQPLWVRAAVDTAAEAAGGRHYVLFQDHQALTLIAYLSAAQEANTSLPVSIIGASLHHERRTSMLVDLVDVSYGVFHSVRARAEEFLKAGLRAHVVRGPRYPLAESAGYHSCVFLGGHLDLAALGARDVDGQVLVVATLDTGEAGGLGHHELLVCDDAVQEPGPILGIRDAVVAVHGGGPAVVEANVWGTLYSIGGRTSVKVTRAKFPPLDPSQGRARPRVLKSKTGSDRPPSNLA